MADHSEVPDLTVEAAHGRREALDTLLPEVYHELRALAHRQLVRFRPGQTLATTVLVHEAYLKLAACDNAKWNDASHFFTLAALAMRQIIVDYARGRRAAKRGGGAVHTLLDPLDGAAVAIQEQSAALLALDEALHKLSSVDERLVRVIELRFFGGLSVEETANVLGVSVPTVKRDTRAARVFVYREMGVT